MRTGTCPHLPQPTRPIIRKIENQRHDYCDKDPHYCDRRNEWDKEFGESGVPSSFAKAMEAKSGEPPLQSANPPVVRLTRSKVRAQGRRSPCAPTALYFVNSTW